MEGAVRDDQIADAVLVVAHPDDEILWFSSILNQVASVLVCFSGVPSSTQVSEGRRRALAQLSLRNLQSLDLVEAEVFNSADWPDPDPVGYGVRVRYRENSSADFSARRYAQNFDELREQLRKKLAGRRLVFTHNPWGEYGHEEHVQVFRAVESLKNELGFRLLVSGYASPRSSGLFGRYAAQLRGGFITRQTRPDSADVFKKIYQAHGCWTWYDDYAWPEQESFLEWGGADVHLHPGAHAPLNLIVVSDALRVRPAMSWVRRMTGSARGLLAALVPDRR